MARRISLPLAQDVSPSEDLPNVDSVRRKLGGRATSDPGAGELVLVLHGKRDERVGVVLFVRGDEIAVWVGEGIVRRTRRADTVASPAAPPIELAGVANDARVFASLGEGKRVRYEPEPGRLGEGTLIEKCRFGGLVLREDGTIIGVGFRRLWPAVEGHVQGN